MQNIVHTDAATDSIKLDDVKIARAILQQAGADIKHNPYGRRENERFLQDQERVLEVIGEAQWFFLDDDDDNATHGFFWCTALAGVDAGYIRKQARAFLVREGSLLTKAERHRLAALAGKRRLRQHFQRPPDLRKKCAKDSCFRLTKVEFCKYCENPALAEATWQDSVCSKCATPIKVVSEHHQRRPYCNACQRLCVRVGCYAIRRAGSRTTTCPVHQRGERTRGVFGTKLGKTYGKPTPSALF